MMKSIARTLSPSVTNLIRMEHSQVLETFHHYEASSAAHVRKALVDTACLALETHAQIEEELFYPAMREAGADSAIVDKSIPEHEEMRRMIAQLRSMSPSEPGYDQAFMQLMRDVMHHVADEETTLLPEAERLLGGRLEELGAQWTKRRMQLSAPHAGEMAMNAMRAFPASTMLVAASAVIAGTYFARRAFNGQAHGRHH